jgi:hypothetical protein
MSWLHRQWSDRHGGVTAEIAHASQHMSNDQLTVERDEVEPVSDRVTLPRLQDDLDFFAPVSSGVGERRTNECEDCVSVSILNVSDRPWHGSMLTAAVSLNAGLETNSRPSLSTLMFASWFLTGIGGCPC